MNTKTIQELAEIIKANGLTRIDIKEKDCHMVLEAQPMPMPPAAAGPMSAADVSVPTADQAAAVDPGLFVQASPIVGTLYLSPDDGGKPFVQVGDTVRQGAIICILESMKLFNDLAAECDGVIEEICAANGEAVGIGQPLFKIRKA